MLLAACQPKQHKLPPSYYLIMAYIVVEVNGALM